MRWRQAMKIGAVVWGVKLAVWTVLCLVFNALVPSKHLEFPDALIIVFIVIVLAVLELLATAAVFVPLTLWFGRKRPGRNGLGWGGALLAGSVSGVVVGTLLGFVEHGGIGQAVVFGIPALIIAEIGAVVAWWLWRRARLGAQSDDVAGIF